MTCRPESLSPCGTPGTRRASLEAKFARAFGLLDEFCLTSLRPPRPGRTARAQAFDMLWGYRSLALDHLRKALLTQRFICGDRHGIR